MHHKNIINFLNFLNKTVFANMNEWRYQYYFDVFMNSDTSSINKYKN